jgi:UDP-N-acetylmuramoylalanine--D-glutamate ligase
MAQAAADVLRFSATKRQERGMWLDGDAIRQGDEEVARVSDTRLPGRHNLQNVLAALCMMRAGGFAWDRVLEGLRGFEGVEHRIEFVLERGGVRIYNDSKSTNIDSLKVALESFSGPVILIAGGRGKGADYRELRDAYAGRVKELVALGEDADLLEEALGDLAPVRRASEMTEAVGAALGDAVAGDTVLLSPACASFDMFDSFEHRGRVFKECVRSLVERGRA